jgi:hypothetical protein
MWEAIADAQHREEPFGVKISREEDEHRQPELQLEEIIVVEFDARFPPEPHRQQHAVRQPHDEILDDVPEIAGIEPAHLLHHDVVDEEERNEDQVEFFRPGPVRVLRKPIAAQHGVSHLIL